MRVRDESHPFSQNGWSSPAGDFGHKLADSGDRGFQRRREGRYLMAELWDGVELCLVHGWGDGYRGRTLDDGSGPELDNREPLDKTFDLSPCQVI